MRKGIQVKLLNKYYIVGRKSVPEIAKILKCSNNKVNYWLQHYKIIKRTISEAIYIKNNPNGDPFKFVPPKNLEEAKLFGMGVGLYWGEGNKANKNTVRLGNSDSKLLKIFIDFLIKFFNIKKEDMKFHLHIFSDIDINEARNFWIKELGIKKEQIYKPMITRTGALGIYKKRSKYGVMTVYYCNVKLRNLLVNILPM